MYQTLPKKKLMENLTLSAADFRSYVKDCVILEQSSAPSKATVCHFQTGKSSIFASRGNVKNNKKCNEELVARVKAMIDEDARISLEKIASALNI